jgi:hypothetical protein
MHAVTQLQKESEEGDYFLGRLMFIRSLGRKHLLINVSLLVVTTLNVEWSGVSCLDNVVM